MVQVDTFQSWVNLLHKDALIKLGPVVLSTLVLYLTMHYVRSPFALPGVLIIIPLVFHAILLAMGCSLATAADNGWVQQPQVGLQSSSFFTEENLEFYSSSSVSASNLPGNLQRSLTGECSAQAVLVF